MFTYYDIITLDFYKLDENTTVYLVELDSKEKTFGIRALSDAQSLNNLSMDPITKATQYWLVEARNLLQLEDSERVILFPAQQLTRSPLSFEEVVKCCGVDPSNIPALNFNAEINQSIYEEWAEATTNAILNNPQDLPNLQQPQFFQGVLVLGVLTIEEYRTFSWHARAILSLNDGVSLRKVIQQLEIGYDRLRWLRLPVLNFLINQVDTILNLPEDKCNFIKKYFNVYFDFISRHDILTFFSNCNEDNFNFITNNIIAMEKLFLNMSDTFTLEILMSLDKLKKQLIIEKWYAVRSLIDSNISTLKIINLEVNLLEFILNNINEIVSLINFISFDKLIEMQKDKSDVLIEKWPHYEYIIQNLNIDFQDMVNLSAKELILIGENRESTVASDILDKLKNNATNLRNRP